MIQKHLSNLLEYAKLHLGLRDVDTMYEANRLAEKLQLDSYDAVLPDTELIKALDCPDSIVAPILDYALKKGLVEEGEEEFFTSEILDMLSPLPSKTIVDFNEKYANSPDGAFDALYDLGVKNDYVKLSAIRKNKEWVAEATKNKLQITINLSKPEKSNKMVAKMRTVSAGYPKCMLCRENVGYVGQGRTRRNMRTVPIKLAGEDWFWQFSPYAYFYQHGIAINCEHTPMALTDKTFDKLLDFVDYAPQYFIGSNACLPIVGGSILAHEHFQGGKAVFPMFFAPEKKSLKTPVQGVSACVLDWYNNVILLKGKDKSAVSEMGKRIFAEWEKYDDESVGIFSRTDAQHNALAPIVEKTKDGYKLYIQLRNNRCDDKHPDGIFHAHKQYHNIKSEAIGLIEAMGRFILPGRLDYQLKEVEKFLTGENTEIAENMTIHTDMIGELLEKHGNKLSAEKAHKVVTERVEWVCERILENTAVFKNDEQGMKAFDRFLSVCGIIE
ncbi:MAG: galactose-1-phosphate uridylyltransferase [Clostridia bacterium]|nr:galactose-1-phosphate uridylyltransferase [Clostridia bacterium]